MFDLATGEMSNLTNTPHDDGDPAWSPDGATIAFWSQGTDGQDIWTIPADGGHPPPRLDRAARRRRRPGLVARRRARRVTPRTAPATGTCSSWRPTAATSSSSPPTRPHDQDPAWSPDGTCIAFETKRDSTDRPENDWAEIYSMLPDGRDQVRVTARDGLDIHHRRGAWPRRPARRDAFADALGVLHDGGPTAHRSRRRWPRCAPCRRDRGRRRQPGRRELARRLPRRRRPRAPLRVPAAGRPAPSVAGAQCSARLDAVDRRRRGAQPGDVDALPHLIVGADVQQYWLPAPVAVPRRHELAGRGAVVARLPGPAAPQRRQPGRTVPSCTAASWACCRPATSTRRSITSTRWSTTPARAPPRRRATRPRPRVGRAYGGGPLSEVMYRPERWASGASRPVPAEDRELIDRVLAARARVAAPVRSPAPPTRRRFRRWCPRQRSTPSPRRRRCARATTPWRSACSRPPTATRRCGWHPARPARCTSGSRTAAAPPGDGGSTSSPWSA